MARGYELMEEPTNVQKLAILFVLAMLGGLFVGLGFADYTWANEVNALSGITNQWHQVMNQRFTRGSICLFLGVLLIAGAAVGLWTSISSISQIKK